MTPEKQALAYRVWAYCDPLGWDCYISDVADTLGVSWQAVAGVARVKGWTNRFRVTRQDNSQNQNRNYFDRDLSREGAIEAATRYARVPQ